MDYEAPMTKRRNVGEIVWKKANAGFIGERLIIKIPDDQLDNTGYCMLSCGDPDCVEYANLYVLNADGSYRGDCCHVSECQMEDI